MSNPNKRKGTSWEVAIRDAGNDILDEEGQPGTIYRPAPNGRADIGDLNGMSPFVGQAKNWADLGAALREGVDGARKQARNAGEEFGVAFIKRRRKSTREGYAVMQIDDFFRLLARLRAAEQD